MILATKATDLEEAAAQLGGNVPRAAVMTIQNGLGAEEIVRTHGDWPLENSPVFAAELRERAAPGAGAEVVLHGLRHDEQGQPRSLWHRLRTFGRTAREAEFASLPAGDAAARIARGLAVLRATGLDPVGFASALRHGS